MASSLGKDLLERKVPHYLAVYLGASWGLVEFFAFLEDRFLLSPHLTNLVLALLVVVLPSVVLFTWFHGRKGRDSWSQTEKVFIPLNILFALVVLFIGFSGKELGAVTTRVTVEDEAGNAVERVVPKGEFRKRVAFFPLDTDTADAGQSWLAEGVTMSVVVDLYQDMFVDFREWDFFKQELEEAGYGTGRGVPGSLKRRLTRDHHLGYYLDGSAEQTADGFRFTLALHDAARGRVLGEHTYDGPDFFSLVDSASVQVRRDLEIPTRHIEDNTDVPVEEILTGSVTALRRFSEASDRVAVSDFPGALELLDQAVAEDPGFAVAQLVRYVASLRMGDPAGARGAIQAAMEHSYRLPERMQYNVKGEWFGMQQDYEKMYAVYEMWAELYPQDIQALRAAAQVRLLQNDRRGAIEALEQILELDPTQLELLQQIGALYQALGELEQARSYLERYAGANPEDKASFTALAILDRQLGRLDEARELYERALLLDPGDTGLKASLASLDRDTGDFEAAEAGYREVLDAAGTPAERFAALRGLTRLYEYRGSYRRAVEYLEQSLELFDSFQPPLPRLQLRLLTLDLYVHAGRTDDAVTMLESLATRMEPPLDALVPIGEIGLYEALEQPAELEAAVERGQAMLDRMGFNVLEQPVVWGRGRVHEMRGEWQEAIAQYERERELSPMEATIPTRLGRCYRELGELERAESLIGEALLAQPSDPQGHLELARVYQAMGRAEDAVRHLERALETWAPADPGYAPAREARELLAALSV